MLGVAGLAAPAAVAPVAGPYDPALDGWKQIQAAGTRAGAEGKRVLVVVGGNWCKWCRALDRLMREDPAVRAEADARFEVVHLNWSKENKNPEAMTRLGNPDKLGFPTLVVLSPGLAVLKVQASDVFETTATRPGHDPAKLLAFLKSWDGREQSSRRTSS
jgi:thiol:disulfide interchange protein